MPNDLHFDVEFLYCNNNTNLHFITSGYTPETFTCDQYAHQVVMDAFLNANNFLSKI